ncbi:hypothetical protein Vretifemale_10882, partial [Volvox reticuliferus]
FVVAAGQPAWFAIEPRDMYGNRVDVRHLSGGGFPLEVSLSNGVLDVPVRVDLADNGKPEYRVSYTAPAVPGFYRLQVLEGSSGRHVGGSPFSVKVVEAVDLVAEAAGGKGVTDRESVSPAVPAAATRSEPPWPMRGTAAAHLSRQPPSELLPVDLVGVWARRAEAALREFDQAKSTASPHISAAASGNAGCAGTERAGFACAPSACMGSGGSRGSTNNDPLSLAAADAAGAEPLPVLMEVTVLEEAAKAAAAAAVEEAATAA